MIEQTPSGNAMLSESKFFMGYSRWDETKNGYETWEESVSRVMNMHRHKYASIMSPELSVAMDFAEEAYKEKLVLGAQRALQFGGEQIFKHESRMYNCSVSYIDRPAFFNECMYLMLSGCFKEGTLVKTKLGNKPIEKITIDDEILSFDEKNNKFIWVKPTIGGGKTNSGKKQKVKITLPTGETIITTDDHKFLTKDGWKDAQNLTASDQIISSDVLDA